MTWELLSQGVGERLETFAEIEGPDSEHEMLRASVEIGPDRLGTLLRWTAHRELFTSIALVWADGAYSGALVTWATQKLALTIEIVKRHDHHAGFVVLPRRWVVERTLAWITRRRRRIRDYERLPEHHEAMVTWSMIILMSRRLAKTTPAQPK
jgi:transposase